MGGEGIDQRGRMFTGEWFIIYAAVVLGLGVAMATVAEVVGARRRVRRLSASGAVRLAEPRRPAVLPRRAVYVRPTASHEQRWRGGDRTDHRSA